MAKDCEHKDITIDRGDKTIRFICKCGEKMQFISETKMKSLKNAIDYLEHLLRRYFHDGSVDEADILNIQESLDELEKAGN